MSSESDGDGDDGDIVPYFISQSNLLNKAELDGIIGNMSRAYYVTPCWKPDFFALLCYCGFVPVAQEPTWLIPELQKEYSLLMPKELYLERNVIKCMKKDIFKITVDQRSEEVYQRIANARESNWLGGKYWALMRSARGGIPVGKGFFKPHTFELTDTTTGELVAGEIGYSIGHTYTALTGFYDPAYPSSGKVQICSMVLFLVSRGIRFINLGHARMEYKYEFGSKDIPRLAFLEGWNQNTAGKCSITGEARPAELLPLCEMYNTSRERAIADPNSKNQRKKAAKKLFRAELKKKKKAEKAAAEAA